MAGSVRAAAGRLLVAQVLLGVGSYAVLLGAGRSLDDDAFAVLALFWSLSFSIGMGLFAPLEQLYARHVAQPQPPAAEIRRLAWLYSGVAVLSAVGVAVLLLAWRTRFPGLDAGLAVTAAAFFLVLFLLSAERGLASGSFRYDLFSRQVGTDGTSRLLLAVLLSIAMPAGAAVEPALAWTLAVAVSGVVGLLVVARWSWRRFGEVAGGDGPAARPWRSTLADVAALTAATTLSTVLANGLPTAAAAAGASTASLAAFSAAVVIARVPVFFVGAAQALVIPRVTRSLAAGSQALHADVTRLVALLAAACSVVFVVTGLLVGPVTRVVYGYDVPSSVAWLLAWSTAMVLLGLITQGVLIATGWTGRVGAVWVLATVVFALALLWPADPAERVATASALSATVAAGLLVALALAAGRAPRTPVSATA